MTIVTIRARGITLERLVFKIAGGSVPGLVERTLDLNPDLAKVADELPLGTRVAIPDVTEPERARTVVPIRLVD